MVLAAPRRDVLTTCDRLAVSVKGPPRARDDGRVSRLEGGLRGTGGHGEGRLRVRSARSALLPSPQPKECQRQDARDVQRQGAPTINPTAGWVVELTLIAGVSGSGSRMVMEMVLLPNAPRESVAVTVNVLVPPAPGVPLMTPVVAFRLNPDGSVPEGMVNVYGGVPPAAVTVCENADSTTPVKLPFVIVTGVEVLAMLIVRLFRATAPLPSVTTIERKFPRMVEFIMTPVPARMRPVGGFRCPSQVKGWVSRSRQLL